MFVGPAYLALYLVFVADAVLVEDLMFVLTVDGLLIEVTLAYNGLAV